MRQQLRHLTARDQLGRGCGSWHTALVALETNHRARAGLAFEESLQSLELAARFLIATFALETAEAL